MIWREETICGISTAAGKGGIGIIRISGDKAESILMNMFRTYGGKKIESVINRHVYSGKVVRPERGVGSGFRESEIDEVVAFIMKAPHSYTCEDVVEIQCHGGLSCLQSVLQAVLEQGAVAAEPGEFTMRAFLNGRLDLSQAEAVMDMIDARTSKAREAALNQLQGGISEYVQSVRNEIDDIIVKLIANIEYPEEEDLEEYDTGILRTDLQILRDKLISLANTADSGRIMREGLKIALTGKPNVGKSSLMNGLLKQTRAIVTDIPGTTRDVIEESVNIKGFPVVISDTAGIRRTGDVIETLGIEKSRLAVENADVIILLLDGSLPISEDDINAASNLSAAPFIVVINKSDLGCCISDDDVLKLIENSNSESEFSDVSVEGSASCDRKKEIIGLVHTSVMTGQGLDELENLIIESAGLSKESTKEFGFMVNARHKMLIDRACDSIDDAMESLAGGLACDFAESDLRIARDYLSEIIGDSVSDDIIKKVFAKFCLGK